MTLELYMQPFFAAAHFYDFKEYVAPRTDVTVDVRQRPRDDRRDARHDGEDRVLHDRSGRRRPRRGVHDSTTATSAQQSLRGNAVFRWEYRPGSVLYVAWTQSRSLTPAFGDLQFDRDRSALFAARPDNIFLVKASWWLPR